MHRLTFLIAALLTALALFAAPARASGTVWLADKACTFYGDRALDPAVVIARRLAPCTRSGEPARSRATYALMGGLNLTPRPGDPLEFSHRTMRLNDERVFFRFADGEITEAPLPPAQAMRPLTTTEMFFPVPVRASPLVAVLVRSEGYENAHGVARRARIAPASVNAAVATRQHLLYGLFGGAIVAMILYNLMLWQGLRYRFLLHYCLIGLAMVGFGLSWSGAIGALWPGLDPKTQVALNFFGYATIIAAIPGFLGAFLEPRHRARRLLRGAGIASGIALAAAVVRLAGFDEAWRLLDLATFGGSIVAMALIAATALRALIRGSIAVRYFLIAWTIPLAFALWRSLWGVGIAIGDGPLIDVAPLAMMALEAILSSLGMAWRIRSLKEERDDAQAMKVVLQQLADTDPMTGLLNRRAFLDRASRRSREQRLMLIDIDRFKAVNDRFGHDAGDRVIVDMARLLANHAPLGALVGRMGGEEFAILADRDAVAGLDDALLRVIAATPMLGGLHLTCSAGIAHGPVRAEGDWERLYREADLALYRAKADGRDRVGHPALARVA